MAEIKLSTLSILLGAAVCALSAYGLMRPGAFGAAAKRFPRHIPAGVALMILATAWFLYNLSLESISDFATFKTGFYVLFAAVGLGTCLFVQDFLGARGLAVVFLLLGKLMVDTARLEPTQWRWVISGWAYVLVIAGMWWTISPWRLRDQIAWFHATEGRTRAVSALKLAFGLLVLALGLSVFKAAENQESQRSELSAPPSPAQNA